MKGLGPTYLLPTAYSTHLKSPKFLAVRIHALRRDIIVLRNKDYLIIHYFFVTFNGIVYHKPANAADSKGKGKDVPLQVWSDREISRKLRFPDFVTTARDGGKVVSLTHKPPSPPGNTPGSNFY